MLPKIIEHFVKDHVTTEEGFGKNQAVIGEYNEFLMIVNKQNLRRFGYVPRCAGLAMTILQVTVDGKNRRDTQKKRWDDNIKEWTGVNFASSTRATEDRTR